MKNLNLISLAELEKMNDLELSSLKGGFANPAISSVNSIMDSEHHDSDNNDHFTEPDENK